MSYAFDDAGTNSNNVIKAPEQEYHPIPNLTPGTNHRIIVPKFSPYYLTGSLQNMKVSLVNGGSTTNLIMGQDWLPMFKFSQATAAVQKPIYGGISILTPGLVGSIALEYHTVGGIWTLEPSAIEDILNSLGGDVTRIYWEQLSGVPEQFPNTPHPHESADLVGLSAIETKFDELITAIQNRGPGVSPADHVALTQSVANQISGLLDQINAAIGGLDVGDLVDRIEAEEAATASQQIINNAYSGYIADVRSRFGTIALVNPSAQLSDYSITAVDAGAGRYRQSFHPAAAHSRYHISGNIGEISLVADSAWHVGKVHSYLYRGSHAQGFLRLLIDGNDINTGTRFFSSYDDNNPGASVGGRFFDIDIFNKEFHFMKLDNGNIMVWFD